jgi:hypothetical protein
MVHRLPNGPESCSQATTEAAEWVMVVAVLVVVVVHGEFGNREETYNLNSERAPHE